MTSSSVPATSSADPTSTAAPTTTAAPASGKPVKVGKGFADQAIGESGTVLAYMRNFQLSAAAKKKYSLLQQDEVVLVEVKVNSSKKYYDSPRFRLLLPSWATTGSATPRTTRSWGRRLIKAGYHPLQDATNGKSSTGWIAFPIGQGIQQAEPAVLHAGREHLERQDDPGSDGEHLPRRMMPTARRRQLGR